MGIKTLRIGIALVAAAIGIAALSAPAAAAAPAAAPADAVWTPKQVQFQYRAFTTQYACDGVGERVRPILLQLGARADAVVRISGCVTRFPEGPPNVYVKVNVLEPSATQSADSVPARWKTVGLQAGTDPLEFAGDCEL